MAISEQKYHELEELAAKIRLDTLCSIKKMGQGHLGGSFSIVELLAVLYGKQLRINPQDPQWADRDRLVLSKGHAGAALYSALANTGYFDRSWLWTINEGG
ncbi:transketolase, partial [Enterococcus faecalis]|nr:transketolase [Enterococcus faecalis]